MTEQMTEAPAQVEAPVPESTTAPKWSPDVETEARALGWKAPDEWKGEVPATYIDDPARYLERAENFTPFRKLKEANSEALRKIEAVTARQMERERASHAEELAKIKAEKVAAVEVGDIDAYKALEKREDKLREAAPDVPRQSAVPDEHRVAIESWSVNKPWFKSDPVMTQAAAMLYGQAQADGLTDPKAILAKVDAEMAKRFTGLAKAAPVEAVEGGLTFGSGSVASPFEKLPKDAKDAFRRFVEKGVFKDTKEDRATYAEDYNAA
jgi:hypothetical protein